MGGNLSESGRSERDSVVAAFGGSIDFQALAELAAVTGRPIRIGVWRRGEIHSLDYPEPSAVAPADRSVSAGGPEAADETAVGRALLAFQSRSTEGLPMEGLQRALAVTRLTKVAIRRRPTRSAPEFAVAVPIFNSVGGVIAAVEITVGDLGPDFPETIAALRKAAERLSPEPSMCGS